jgi:hypothetical protein
MILFLTILLMAFNPVGWALLRLAIAALVAFGLLPFGWAVAATVVLTPMLGAGAVAELTDRRARRLDDATLRRAAVRRARRYLDES